MSFEGLDPGGHGSRLDAPGLASEANRFGSVPNEQMPYRFPAGSHSLPGCAKLNAIDPLPSLSTKLKWEGLFLSGALCEAKPILGRTGLPFCVAGVSRSATTLFAQSFLLPRTTTGSRAISDTFRSHRTTVTIPSFLVSRIIHCS